MTQPIAPPLTRPARAVGGAPDSTIHVHRAGAEPAAASVLMFGVPKVGKTAAALAFPKPFVIATGANTGTLEQHKGLPYITPADWGGDWTGFRTKVLPFLRERRAHHLIGPDTPPEGVQTIVIDELNNLFQILVDQITGPDPSRKWAIHEFGRFSAETGPILRHLAGLKTNRVGVGGIMLPKYNVVVTCHVRDVGDGDGNIASIAPIILGQTKDMVGAHFDFVTLLTKETETSIDDQKRVVRTPTYYAYTSPPDKLTTRLGLGGSLADGLPARIQLKQSADLYSLLKPKLA